MQRHPRVPAPTLGDSVKVSFKRHILPPLFGVLAMVLVLGVFNSQFIAAKISASTYTPPSTTATQEKDETTAKKPVDPNQPAKITINNISVNAPIIFDEKQIDETSFQLALRRGVVHYPYTAVPGQAGNVVIFGHSSGQVWAPGEYKFVFSRLEKLAPGYKLFIDYRGVRYSYEVTGTKVVPPTDVSVLRQTKDNTLTLITCTPVGTDKNRLIVSAEQIDPVPETKKVQKAPAEITEVNRLPDSQGPSLWESIKAWFQ